MSKASIVSVDIRDDNSVVVYYSTGTCRPYKSAEVLPKTVRAWLDSHQTPEAVTVTATADGVQITAQETLEIRNEANFKNVNASKFDKSKAEATETAVETVERAQMVIYTPCTVDVKTEPITATEAGDPEPVRLKPVTVAQLAALGAAYTGLRCLAVGCHTLAITAEIAEAVREITAEIRADTKHAIHKTAARIRGKAEAAADAIRTAVRRSQNRLRRAWGIISTAATETVRKTAIQAREAWLWRAELVTAATIMG